MGKDERRLCDHTNESMVRVAVLDDAESVYKLVQETIRAVYPDHYEPAIVDGCCRLHNLDAITTDIELGRVRVLESGSRLVGTGTLEGEHITRVFVSPEMQGRGFGTCVMDALEGEAAKGLAATVIESSVPAEPFYLHRGYDVVDRGVWNVEATAEQPSATLVYKIMEKSLLQKS